MDNDKILTYFGGAFALVVMLVFLFIQPPWVDPLCHANKGYRDANFEGVVINKFIDWENHAYRVIELNSYKKRIYLDAGRQKFYDEFQVGDSISKPAGTLMVNIFRSDQKKTVDFEYPCEQ
ncbi:MAG: hypothetical protein KDD63_15075 [Bacteroidetes bacterium]|nr:hypothetical protein [Bacteroidota bacterium]